MNPGRLIKKIFSLTLSAFAVLIVSGFLSLQPINEQPAYAQNTAGYMPTGSSGSGTGSSTCTDITLVSGKTATDSVTVSGIANSGQVDFSSPSDTTMQACAETPTVNQSALKGWAWNTNLGWMSFYCSGGGSGANLGISCGSISYGATLDTSTGAISGFAWGDNIGWISMSGATYGVRVAVADGDAGTACTNSKKGDLYGYAWTDTVGWMNFCGAHVDLSALETPPDTTPPDTGTTPPGTGTTPPGTGITSPDSGVIDVANQVADIQGNVSLNIVDTSGLAIKNKIGQSLGEQAQSRRESFYRAVKSSMKGDFTKIGTTSISTINKDIVYYSSDTKKPCTIILDGPNNSGTLDINGNSVIVAKGCNIFIDSNLTVPTGGSGRLGIIALQDLTIPGEQKGGNIYVCGRVTDIEANLVADGALISYGNATDSKTPCTKSLDSTTGYPLFGYQNWTEAMSNIATIRQFLRNQLTIYGSLVSNNTYGGSVSDKSPPPTEYVLGDGSKGTQEEARLFDLNYLRYAKTELMSDGIADEKCWMSDVGLSKYFGVATPLNPCDALNTPDTTSIVNIIYRAPTSKMPVFNAVK